MSYLSSKFDIVSVDNPLALASLAQVLPVAGGMTLDGNGTPVPGTIAPGAIVTMDGSGNAVLATTPDISAAQSLLVFVTVDGNVDFSGSYVQKLTVLHGGFTMMTDQYEAGAYTPGKDLTFNAGKVKLRTAATQQRFGFVGPAGLDSTNGVLQVIVPQGCGI